MTYATHVCIGSLCFMGIIGSGVVTFFMWSLMRMASIEDDRRAKLEWEAQQQVRSNRISRSDGDNC